MLTLEPGDLPVLSNTDSTSDRGGFLSACFFAASLSCSEIMRFFYVKNYLKKSEWREDLKQIF